MPTLVIGNKCHSSWSLRPWILMKQFDIPLRGGADPLRRPDRLAGVEGRDRASTRRPARCRRWSTARSRCGSRSPSWSTSPKRIPSAPIWPRDRAARAMARVDRLRDACRLLGHARRLPDEPRQALRLQGPRRRRRRRMRRASPRSGARRASASAQGGPFLFGAFSAADAMYAPMVTRFDTYSIPADGRRRAYMDAVMGTPAFREWRERGPCGDLDRARRRGRRGADRGLPQAAARRA